MKAPKMSKPFEVTPKVAVLGLSTIAFTVAAMAGVSIVAVAKACSNPGLKSQKVAAKIERKQAEARRKLEEDEEERARKKKWELDKLE